MLIDRFFVFIMLFIILSVDLFSQIDSAGKIYIDKFSSAEVILKNSNKIKTGSLKLYKNCIIFENKETENYETVILDDIYIIKAAKKSHIFAGGVIGGSLGLLFPLTKSEINNEPYPNVGFLATHTAFWTIIGCIIGYSVKDYKTVYHSGDFFITFDNNIKTIPPENLLNNFIQINFQIHLN